ncbi:MAG: hypothetical protein ACPGSB_12505, partial [Opitutales bacterium]
PAGKTLHRRLASLSPEISCPLDLDDLDIASASILIREGKGGKDRLLPLASTTIRWINAYLQRSRPKLTVDPGEKAAFISG